MINDKDTQIGTLRIRSPEEAKTPAFSRRISSLLDTVEFQPSGIPPSGILIVKHLDDPLPGQLMPSQDSFRAHPQWENALKDALKTHYRTAARPINLMIPPQAEAVFFEDRGQLIAALALDLFRGTAFDSWWWKVILKTLHPSFHLKSLFYSNPQYLPSAFLYLAQSNTLFPILESLSQQDILHISDALCRQFHIEHLLTHLLQDESSFSPPAPFEIPHSLFSSVSPIQGEDSFHGIARSFFSSPSPFSIAFNPFPHESVFPSILTEYIHSMKDHHAALAFISLSLYYEPSFTSTPSFSLQFQQWWEYRLWQRNIESVDAISSRIFTQKTPGEDDFLPHISGVQKNTTEPMNSQNTMSPSPVPQDGEEFVSAFIENVPVSFSSVSPFNEKEEEAPLRFHHPSSSLDSSQVQTQTAPPHLLDPEQKPRPNRRQSSDEPSDLTPIQFKDIQPLSVSSLPSQEVPEEIGERTLILPIEEAVVTSLAGVFYLVNLIRELDLPHCFDDQCPLSRTIGAWGVLELLARGILSRSSLVTQNDLIWKILAQADHRELPIPPGVNFYLPHDLYLPQKWQSYKFSSLSVNQDMQPIHSAHPLLKDLNPSVFRWLEFVIPFICSLLHERLNITSPRQQDWIPVLIVYPGKVYLTTSHVDVVMSLDHISMPVRVAGLDCNPGWVPDFGRVFYFHFS